MLVREDNPLRNALRTKRKGKVSGYEIRQATACSGKRYCRNIRCRCVRAVQIILLQGNGISEDANATVTTKIERAIS